MTPPFDLDTLLAYHLGELDAAAEAELEEQVFADAATARRLEAVVHMADALRSLGRAGLPVSAVLTTGTLARMTREGLTVRTYLVAPGETVPCGNGPEDLVAVHLCGAFPGETADLEIELRPEGQPYRTEHRAAAPVDPVSREVVLVHPASFIRSLPRTRLRFLARGTGGEPDREFFLDHDPART